MMPGSDRMRKGRLPCLVCLGFALLLGVHGCGRKPSATPPTSPDSRPVTSNPATGTKTESGKAVDRPLDPQGIAALAKLEEARRRDEEFSGRLQQASNMMKSGDLEGALRQVTRLQQEHARDPYAGMQVAYLRAVIHHRMKDPAKRKEAMNDLLKQMEAAQKDPGFTAAFQEGMDAQAVIKMTLEKAGKRYGLP